MADASKDKPPRSSTSSKNRQNSPPPYRSHAETSMEDFVNEFWQHAMNVAEHHEDDFKHQALPLARIKKVAKMDPEVQQQMISSEVTVLFEKACQIFIQELTARAHLVSLAARRRTLSQADVAQAVSRSDMFDFLIDIVPRTEQRAATSTSTNTGPSAGSGASGGGGGTKRPSRSRKHSQQNSPAASGGGPGVGGEYSVTAGPSGTGGHRGDRNGGEGPADGGLGEPRAKRFRTEEEGPQDALAPGQQPSAFATMVPTQAAAAAVTGYYMPQPLPDATKPRQARFTTGQLPWGPPFDYNNPVDANLHAFYQAQGGNGTNGVDPGPGR